MKFKEFSGLLGGSQRPTEPVHSQAWCYNVAAPETADHMLDAIHVQLVGEKHWYAMPPQAGLKYLDDGSPDWQGLIDEPTTELMQCTLKHGDVLYLPALWWHRIELLSDSIGLGRKCLGIDLAKLRP